MSGDACSALNCEMISMLQVSFCPASSTCRIAVAVDTQCLARGGSGNLVCAASQPAVMQYMDLPWTDCQFHTQEAGCLARWWKW